MEDDVGSWSGECYARPSHQGVTAGKRQMLSLHGYLEVPEAVWRVHDEKSPCWIAVASSLERDVVTTVLEQGEAGGDKLNVAIAQSGRRGGTKARIRAHAHAMSCFLSPIGAMDCLIGKRKGKAKYGGGSLGGPLSSSCLGPCFCFICLTDFFSTSFLSKAASL